MLQTTVSLLNIGPSSSVGTIPLLNIQLIETAIFKQIQEFKSSAHHNSVGYFRSIMVETTIHAVTHCPTDGIGGLINCSRCVYTKMLHNIIAIDDCFMSLDLQDQWMWANKPILETMEGQSSIAMDFWDCLEILCQKSLFETHPKQMLSLWKNDSWQCSVINMTMANAQCTKHNCRTQYWYHIMALLV